ncbi:site-specific integrase [Streptomyces goshikiensis]|uniref:site-specific integrase n=1 Tax=Streptomyces goshikiensis TaxID=1942 RepID=UPI0036CB109F
MESSSWSGPDFPDFGYCADFLRRTLRIEQQLVQEPGRGMYLDSLKTGAGRRVLPITKRTVDLLAAYIAKSTCRKAGVEPRHWHELRHHYASVLIAGNENPKVGSRRLGHKDVMTTMRTYAHLFAEAEEKTRDVLDLAWAESGDDAAAESPAAGGRIPESRGAITVLQQVIG